MLVIKPQMLSSLVSALNTHSGARPKCDEASGNCVDVTLSRRSLGKHLVIYGTKVE